MLAVIDAVHHRSPGRLPCWFWSSRLQIEVAAAVMRPFKQTTLRALPVRLSACPTPAHNSKTENKPTTSVNVSREKE